jgi:hypothetical protein
MGAYSDATMHIMGCFVPQQGWVLLDSNDILPHNQDDRNNVSIAHLEYIAFILTFLLLHHLQPHLPHYHIHIDNQNAQAWSSGRVKTSDPTANSLTLINSMLQVALKKDQSRSYITSEMNFEADAITRQKCPQSVGTSQLWPSNQIKQFFKTLLIRQESNPLLLAALINTLLDNEGSQLFLSYST